VRKSILYTLFKLGRLPREAARQLQAEGFVLLEEGLRASVILRKFRAPGRYHSYKASLFTGSLVITEQRFAAFAFSRPLVNIGLHDDHLRSLDVSVPRAGLLSIRFDAGAFDTQSSGTVECRYHTDKARLFLERLEATRTGT
jgi:hypothetical protein